LIIHWPKQFENGRRTGLVELNDLPQTLLDLCGLPAHEGMQGHSLVPMLRENRESPHSSVYCEYLNAMPWHKEPKAFATMVRTEKYKLVAAHSDMAFGTADNTGHPSGELYDLTNDPGEHVNLYNNPEYIGIKAELMERLLYHWSCTADPLPVRKSDW
jgi:arylsulfatase A-like enzyme